MTTRYSDAALVKQAELARKIVARQPVTVADGRGLLEPRHRRNVESHQPGGQSVTAPIEDGQAQQPKRMNPKALRQTLYWLTLDWIHLRTQLPTPTNTNNTGARIRTSRKEYGHPAEWASDKAAKIVTLVTGWHDYLAEHRNETPPPQGNEQHRLVAAWKYLEPRLEQLCELVEHEALKELPDLHHGIRRALGHTKPRYTLPVPCPSTDCGLRTLERCIGIGQDFIICGACGYTVRDDPAGNNYRWLVRVCLDTLIATPATT